MNEFKIEGNIEATIYCSILQQTKHHYLRKDIIYNIYAIELKEIAITLEIVKENDVKYIKYEIQATIETANNQVNAKHL